MQSVDSSSDQRSQANLGTRSSYPLARISSAVPRGYAVTAAGRTKKKQAALGAEGVLDKTGGDESREVVAGGKLESSA